MNGEKVASAAHADVADVVMPLPGHPAPRGLTFVLMLAAIAGTIAAAAALGAFVPSRGGRAAADRAAIAATQAARGAEETGIANQRLILESARLLAAVEDNQRVMLQNQDCTKALLLILPEQRNRLPVAEVNRLCPTTPRFVPTTTTSTTTTTTTTLRRTATTRPRRTTTTRRRSATTRPATTTTAARVTPTSSPPTTCLTVPSPVPGRGGQCAQPQ